MLFTLVVYSDYNIQKLAQTAYKAGFHLVGALQMLTPETFGERVKEYVELDEQIKSGAKMISALRKKQKEISESLLEFMKMKEIAACNISSTGGKLMRKPKRSVQPVKRDVVEELLGKEFQDPNMAEKLADMIWQNRGVVEKEVLKHQMQKSSEAELIVA